MMFRLGLAEFSIVLVLMTTACRRSSSQLSISEEQKKFNTCQETVKKWAIEAGPESMGIGDEEQQARLTKYLKDLQAPESSYSVKETRGRVSQLSIKRESSSPNYKVNLSRSISGVDWSNEDGSSHEKSIQIENKVMVLQVTESLPVFISSSFIRLPVGDGKCPTEEMYAYAKGYIEFEKQSDGKITASQLISNSPVGYFKKASLTLSIEEYSKSKPSLDFTKDSLQALKEQTLTEISWDPLSIPFVGREHSMEIRNIGSHFGKNDASGVSSQHKDFIVSIDDKTKLPIGYISVAEDYTSGNYSSPQGDEVETFGFSKEAWLMYQISSDQIDESFAGYGFSYDDLKTPGLKIELQASRPLDFENFPEYFNVSKRGNLAGGQIHRYTLETNLKRYAEELAHDLPTTFDPIYSPYLAESAYFDFSDANLAKRITKLKQRLGGIRNQAVILNAILNEVNTMKYSYAYNAVGGTPPASHVLQVGRGNCRSFSIAFVALARGLGVPARVVGGLTLRTGNDKIDNGYHSWVEVLLDGKRWYPLEPQSNDLYQGSYGFLPLSVAELNVKNGVAIEQNDNLISSMMNSYSYKLFKVEKNEE